MKKMKKGKGLDEIKRQELNDLIGENRERFTENLLRILVREGKIDDFVRFEKNSLPDRKGIDFEIKTKKGRVAYLDVKSSPLAFWRTLVKKQARHYLDEIPIIYYIPNLSDLRKEKKRLLSLIKSNHLFRTALNG